MELSPRWRKALLTVHVATAVSWLGADVVLVTLGAAGLTGNTAVYPAMAVVGALLVPLTVVIWLVGVLNGLLTRWGVLTWWWVAVKFGITTVMVLLVLFLLGPALAGAGDLGAALPRRERVNLVVAPSVSGSLLVLATVLSTYKPWGRVRGPASAGRGAAGAAATPAGRPAAGRVPPGRR